MAVHGQGALLGSFDYEGDADMDEWQAREHIGERVAVPGFIRGRRYTAAEGHPRYVMFYETDSVDVFSSAPYLERLNAPTDWSRRCSPGLSNMTRSLCRITATAGQLDGGALATIAIEPERGRATELRRWIADDVIPGLVARRGVYAAHLLEADEAASRIETVEKALRSAPDVVVSWSLVVEGGDERRIREAIDGIAPAKAFRDHGASSGSPYVFRLAFALAR